MTRLDGLVKETLERQFWDEELDQVFIRNPELEKFAKRIHDDLNPLKTLNLFKQITPQDCELFGLDPAKVVDQKCIFGDIYLHPCLY